MLNPLQILFLVQTAQATLTSETSPLKPRQNPGTAADGSFELPRDLAYAVDAACGDSRCIAPRQNFGRVDPRCIVSMAEDLMRSAGPDMPLEGLYNYIRGVNDETILPVFREAQYQAAMGAVLVESGNILPRMYSTISTAATAAFGFMAFRLAFTYLVQHMHVINKTSIQSKYLKVGEEASQCPVESSVALKCDNPLCEGFDGHCKPGSALQTCDCKESKDTCPVDEDMPFCGLCGQEDGSGYCSDGGKLKDCECMKDDAKYIYPEPSEPAESFMGLPKISDNPHDTDTSSGEGDYASGTCTFHLNEWENCEDDHHNLYGDIEIKDNNGKVIGKTNTKDNPLGVSINADNPLKMKSKLPDVLTVIGQHSSDYVQFAYKDQSWKSTDKVKDGKAGCSQGGWDPKKGAVCIGKYQKEAKRQMDCSFKC